VVKTKNPPPSGSGFDKFRGRIKTRLPRWSAPRSQAAGLSFDSRVENNEALGAGQMIVCLGFNGLIMKGESEITTKRKTMAKHFFSVSVMTVAANWIRKLSE
jgi:hypothetical protein